MTVAAVTGGHRPDVDQVTLGTFTYHPTVTDVSRTTPQQQAIERIQYDLLVEVRRLADGATGPEGWLDVAAEDVDIWGTEFQSPCPTGPICASVQFISRPDETIYQADFTYLNGMWIRGDGDPRPVGGN